MIMPTRPPPPSPEPGIWCRGDKTISKWVPWYAWYPVKTISKRRVWLKPIFVRSIGAFGYRFSYRQYGDSFDLLK